ncbi:MAG: SDR family NAD(P)-dependent oxidoreductase [Chlorogloeopsis fritschii C42_A2020_084]|uniref:SDR family NAD(P)-dependent oxidoreductase n=1 Tax=Chlorogloeopsis fritschii TaxID=1124 RepID=UPI0019F3C29D|nr:SDR family NAD(P)-dependent oxidoreductase [Chlorogloeopsis fritschii]MBF2008683.1 SDR family NAD(P)-dependent oxidoreductase [Chlorogloeopsis fritschii C42_A2020_084]
MISQKVAIITAASGGIGLGCARELAARGYKVSLLARSKSILELASELSGIATQGSITNFRDLQQLVETTLANFDRIDAVVNSFGDPPRPDLLSVLLGNLVRIT